MMEQQLKIKDSNLVGIFDLATRLAQQIFGI